MKFQSVAVYALAAIAMITLLSSAEAQKAKGWRKHAQKGLKVWDKFWSSPYGKHAGAGMPGGKIQGINKFRPNYDPYIRDELDDEDDDDVVGGFACMQMCADGTARCACGPMPRRV